MSLKQPLGEYSCEGLPEQTEVVRKLDEMTIVGPFFPKELLYFKVLAHRVEGTIRQQ